MINDDPEATMTGFVLSVVALAMPFALLALRGGRRLRESEQAVCALLPVQPSHGHDFGARYES